VPPVRQKVEAIAELRRDAERQVTRHQRVVEVFMEQLGRPRTLYGLLALVVAWVGINVGLPGLRWDAPPFFWLQGLLTVLSVTTTSVVLITQRRHLLRTAQHSQLDLHINLLAEEKVAKLVALLEELRRDLPSVPDRPDPEAAAMSRGTDARELADELQRSLDREAAGLDVEGAEAPAAESVAPPPESGPVGRD
jgi:uncharacterized membrane protein